MPDYLTGKNPHAKSLPPPHDPGYVLHYLPYDNYQPHHPESLAHPPPVPHLPHAAHMLVPGTHVPPPPHTPLLHPHSLVTPAPLLHPHAVLEAGPLPPQPSFLPALRGARKKRSGQSLPLLANTLHTTPLSSSSQSDTDHDPHHDYYDSAESRLVGLFNTTSDGKVHLCSHGEPCLNLIQGGQHSDFNIPPGFIVTPPDLFKNLPKNNFQPVDSNSLPLTLSEIVNIQNIVTENTTENITNQLTRLPSQPPPPPPPPVPISSTANSRIFHQTSVFDHFIEETTTSTPSFQSTTPGSIPSNPSWIFPTEGSRKKTRKPLSVLGLDQTQSVYFDPSLRKDFNDLNKVDV